MLDLTDSIYSSPELAREHLERLQWPNGPVCPRCGNDDQARITRLKGKSTRPGVYKCRACAKPFTVTVGTVFERSHVPLNKWVLAAHLYASSKKGMSAHQLHRMLGVTYKTAWFMAHRLREAMSAAPGNDDAATGPGQNAGAAGDRRPTLDAAGHRMGRSQGDDPAAGRDEKETEETRDEADTKALRHALRQVYQHCADRHRHRYLAEFSFRHDHRAALGVDDHERATEILRGARHKRLTYRSLS